MHKKKFRKITASAIAVLILSLTITIFIFARAYSSLSEEIITSPLSPSQATALQTVLNKTYPDRSQSYIAPLPYKVKEAELEISAKSAILFDATTGSVLYKKNSSEKIPPASLTKIVEMFVVLDQVERGNISLDDIVPLPPESWAENLPLDASRMGLTEDSHVTLRDLLTGLAVVSGNDASIAVADYVCGNMEDFVKKMNEAVLQAGLSQTQFVESSGYSEKNITTAKEFASFARLYINTFPYALDEFHAKKQLGKMENTNKLLWTLDGCDGLKTGYIEESGYNICVTAKRRGNRFVSVTLGGPGNSTQEGNEGRVKDNTRLLEFAFNNFADYKANHHYQVKVLGAKEDSFFAIPATSESLTVPFIKGNSVADSVKEVRAIARLPNRMKGSVQVGEKIGTISYILGDITLNEIPLVADRNIEEGNFLQRTWGSIQSILLPQKVKTIED